MILKVVYRVYQILQTRMNKALTGYDAVYRRCTAAVPCCTTDLQLHQQNNIKHGLENRCLCRL